MNKHKQFVTNFNESIDSINKYLEHPNLEMRHIAQWLYNTDHNPFAIFNDRTNRRGSMMGCPIGFLSLLSNIHYGLQGDIDLSFPVVDGSPSIAFESRDALTETFLNSAQINSISRGVRDSSYYNVTFLNNVFEFTKLFDITELASIKRCFMIDAKSRGVEFAIKQYESEYPCYDSSWVDEFIYQKENLK